MNPREIRLHHPKITLPEIKRPDLEKVGRVIWKSRKQWAAVGIIAVANVVGYGIAINALNRLAVAENNLAQDESRLELDELVIQKLIQRDVAGLNRSCITAAHVQALEKLPNGLTKEDCDIYTQAEMQYWQQLIKDAVDAQNSSTK